ncbi:helix-turn-helix domain-containing protein [Streptomyces sp. NPDC058773]|uniref:helix-turn-helix domain-containing protein n=1 Tax=Streptomyces sp. NPDC058773 TaxID=3346632 RepID=UPI0036788123
MLVTTVGADQGDASRRHRRLVDDDGCAGGGGGRRAGSGAVRHRTGARGALCAPGERPRPADVPGRLRAAALTLHPNTVDNRLARVSALTGLDLPTPRGTALALAALLLRDTEERGPEPPPDGA